MSTSLVRKGLELFADESVAGLESTASRKRKKGPSSVRREDMMERINTNKRGVKKQLNKIRHKEMRKPSAKEGKIKSSIDAYKKSQPSDNTEANLELLLGLSRSNPDTSSGLYTKILKHSRGKLSKDREAEEEPTEKEGGFTDEDFELFAKEYVPMKKGAVL
ncbi:uncharacterized protein LOC121423092 isoform X2 [Lytechinus variegatus]|uniref:uncharacterized protein LOC121423092 isoform X2 n=1 Tax=Lytechinus variegatus TaxID=7654 RepID=UPI001BB14B75|nr:uncharacterized protein LOC121423092 isoform X2 [Lytechinus variegatus]